MPDIYVNLNARLQPMHRGDRFEDPLLEVLEGTPGPTFSVTGGGTLMAAGGEPSNCDIDLEFEGDQDEAMALVVAALERLGAPLGSTARFGDSDEKVSLGSTEGLGIYLNGSDLPDEVYQTSDVNELIARLDERLAGVGEMFSHWQGPTETALYYYGTSAARMRELTADVLATHPLAQRSRIEAITPTR